MLEWVPTCSGASWSEAQQLLTGSSVSALQERRKTLEVMAGISMESLILAQDERWRRASYMQVERGPSSGNTREDRVANG